MNCKKCGAELHPDQKVCLACGTLTVAGGGFDYGHKEPWRPTRPMIYAGVGIVALLIIAAIVRALSVVPPEVVAKEWFGAMSDRQIRTAEMMITPNMQTDLQAKMLDLRALSDEYFSEISANNATFEAGKPRFDSPSSARVVISVRSASSPISSKTLEMVKIGRCWRVNRVL